MRRFPSAWRPRGQSRLVQCRSPLYDPIVTHANRSMSQRSVGPCPNVVSTTKSTKHDHIGRKSLGNANGRRRDDTRIPDQKRPLPTVRRNIRRG